MFSQNCRCNFLHLLHGMSFEFRIECQQLSASYNNAHAFYKMRTTPSYGLQATNKECNPVYCNNPTSACCAAALVLIQNCAQDHFTTLSTSLQDH